MSDGVLLCLALAVAVGGMGCLALSLGAHWRQVFADLAQTRGTALGLRLAGAALLVASFLLCATANPVSMAALVWPMLLTVAAAIVATVLTVLAQGARRRAARRAGRSREA
jgi:hypothetical protein